MVQVRLCAVWPMENWLGTSKTTYRVGWMIWICYSRALERRCLEEGEQVRLRRRRLRGKKFIKRDSSEEPHFQASSSPYLSRLGRRLVLSPNINSEHSRYTMLPFPRKMGKARKRRLKDPEVWATAINLEFLKSAPPLDASANASKRAHARTEVQGCAKECAARQSDLPIYYSPIRQFRIVLAQFSELSAILLLKPV